MIDALYGYELVYDYDLSSEIDPQPTVDAYPEMEYRGLRIYRAQDEHGNRYIVADLFVGMKRLIAPTWAALWSSHDAVKMRYEVLSLLQPYGYAIIGPSPTLIRVRDDDWKQYGQCFKLTYRLLVDPSTPVDNSP